jgi:hypothetical protein
MHEHFVEIAPANEYLFGWVRKNPPDHCDGLLKHRRIVEPFLGITGQVHPHKMLSSEKEKPVD